MSEKQEPKLTIEERLDKMWEEKNQLYQDVCLHKEILENDLEWLKTKRTEDEENA